MSERWMGSLQQESQVALSDRETGWRKEMRGGQLGARSWLVSARCRVVCLHTCRSFTQKTPHRTLKLLVSTGAVEKSH